MINKEYVWWYFFSLFFLFKICKINKSIISVIPRLVLVIEPMYDFSVEEGESFSLHCSVQNPESLVNIENGSLELTKNGNKLPGNSCTLCFLYIMHSYIYFIATVIVCFNSRAFEDMISAHGIHSYFSCFQH